MRKFDPVKHEEKRTEILAAAGRCFAMKGFQGATIAQICAEAGISPGHLYHYFANKEAIVGAITGAGLDYARSRFSDIADGSDPIASIVEEIDRLNAHNRKGAPGVLLEILAEAARNPAVGRTLQEQSQGMRELLAEFLRRGQARGMIDPDLDVDSTAAVLISLIDARKALSIRAPELDTDKSSKVLETMITRFLSPPTDTPSRHTLS